MERVSLAQVARWIGVSAPGGAEAVQIGPDVVIDSRATTPGALFVALPGERVDGHDYVAAAHEAGAAAALVTHPVEDVPHLVVDDGQEALTRLATAVVADARASGLQVVGVTGSAGKTSTKDLLAQVLGSVAATIAPPGSFNNELGHPLTAAQVTHDTGFLVSEMGARGPGQVAHLCAVTPPTVGVVLNVGHAHLGEFGSVDAIAQAKGELVEALGEDGWAVLNADDPRVLGMASRTPARIATWSTNGEPADGDLRVWASDVGHDDLQRHRFVLHAAGAASGRAPVELGLVGGHHVGNALATAAAALGLGVGLPEVAAALSQATALSRWRMELTERPDGVAVLNDAYNANPDSMAAALVTLEGLRRPDGRLIAVLGDMLELGPDAPEQHRRMGALAAQVGVDELLTTGPLGAEIVAGFAERGKVGHHWPNKADLVSHLAGMVHQADVVLLKASRGLAFETIAEALLAHDEGADR